MLRKIGFAVGLLLATLGTVPVLLALLWYTSKQPNPTAFDTPIDLTGIPIQVPFIADFDEEYGVFLTFKLPLGTKEHDGTFNCVPHAEPAPGAYCDALARLEIRWSVVDLASGQVVQQRNVRPWYFHPGTPVSQIEACLGGFRGSLGHRYVLRASILSRDASLLRSNPRLLAYVPNVYFGLAELAYSALAFWAAIGGGTSLLIGLSLALLCRPR